MGGLNGSQELPQVCLITLVDCHLARSPWGWKCASPGDADQGILQFRLPRFDANSLVRSAFLQSVGKREPSQFTPALERTLHAAILTPVGYFTLKVRAVQHGARNWLQFGRRSV